MTEEAVRLLREAAQALEETGGDVFLPTRDRNAPAEEREGIRAVAQAVLPEGDGMDGGTRVRIRDLAFLVQYIADMLEL